MSGLMFIVLALGISVFSFLLSKTVLYSKSSHDPIAYAAFSFFLGGIYAGILYMITSFHIQDMYVFFRPQVFLLIFVDIFAWAIGTCFFYPAYKQLPVSESTIVYSLQGFFALVIGLFLFRTEQFSFIHLLGGICILFAVILVSYQKKGWKINTYSLLLLIATSIFGLGTILDNLIIARGYFSSVVFLQILNFGITAFVVLLCSPRSLAGLKSIYANKRALITLIISSFSVFLSFFFVYNAYKLSIKASQANLILSSQTVLIVLLGALFFKEKSNFFKKIIAAVIVGIGVYLIS